jgi:formylglycine-generating enzyme required for sulfatase activity
MRKIFGLIIAIFCLMGMPAQAQAARKGTAIKSTHPAKSGKTFRNCRSCPQMVVIYSGRFNMGSPDSEEGRGDDEGPVHSVKIAAFAIGKTEITRGQFANLKSAKATGASPASRKATWILSSASTGMMHWPMRNGCHARQEKDTVCQQRLNGNMPPVAGQAPHVTGETTLIRPAHMRMARTKPHRQR